MVVAENSDAFVFFGATGDLAYKKKTLLAHIHEDARAPHQLGR